MSTIIERIASLKLPPQQFVVIGSGIMEAYGLRNAKDIDLVVSDSLYETLENNPSFQLMTRGDDKYLIQEGLEVWTDWNDALFEELSQESVIINGVRFANPSVVIDYKRKRGLNKDLADIKLLEDYAKRR